MLTKKTTTPIVGIIVDTSNLYFAAKAKLDGKLNYKLLYDLAADGREVFNATAYLTESHRNKPCVGFLQTLHQIGFDTKVKKIKYRDDGSPESNWDVGMALDVADLLGEIDTLVVIAGGGNLSELVSYAKAFGTRVEVIGVEDTISSSMMELADGVTTLDKAHLING